MHSIAIQTRRESFDKILPLLGEMQKTVLSLIMESGDRGISAWQISDKLGCYVHVIRPRITELLNMGQVKDCGRRICDKTGRSEAIWKLAELRIDNKGQGVLW